MDELEMRPGVKNSKQKVVQFEIWPRIAPLKLQNCSY